MTLDRFEIAQQILQLSPYEQDLLLGWLLGRKQLEHVPKPEKAPMRRLAKPHSFFSVDDL